MKELVQDRELSLKSFDLGDNRILVEGALTDNRFRIKDHEPPTDSKLIHYMIVKLIVRGPEMLIETAEAEMPQHPREQCPVVLPWIKRLEGLNVVGGFTMKVKETIGNENGCSHLTSLVISMGPAAVQGYWAAYGVERQKMRLKETAVKNIVNTCYLWRENGPLVAGLREAEKAGSEADIT